MLSPPPPLAPARPGAAPWQGQEVPGLCRLLSRLQAGMSLLSPSFLLGLRVSRRVLGSGSSCELDARASPRHNIWRGGREPARLSWLPGRKHPGKLRCGWVDEGHRGQRGAGGSRGGCREPSTPGWPAGLVCSRLAAEEALGRWGLRWVLHRTEPPVQGGEDGPEHPSPPAPVLGSTSPALQAPVAPAAAAPTVRREDQR